MLPSIPKRPFRPRRSLQSHPLRNGPLPPLHRHGEGCPQGGVSFPRPAASIPARGLCSTPERTGVSRRALASARNPAGVQSTAAITR